jgi:DNA-binding MarR family transcriptional regulator
MKGQQQDQDPRPDEPLDLADEPDSRHGRRILAALRRMIRAVDLYSRRLASEHRITGPQLVCLNTIVELGPITATDLAHEVQLSASTVVRILDKLEAKGMVMRERQSADRRRILVSATGRGSELSAKAPYSDRHPLRQALKNLPPSEQEAITQLLERLVDLMDAQQLSTAPLLEVGSLSNAEQAADALEPTANRNREEPGRPD